MIDLPADLAALLRFGDIDPAHVREWTIDGDKYVVRLDWAPGVVNISLVIPPEARQAIAERGDLYRAAREATDEVMSPGAYGEINQGHPHPRVQAEAQESLRARSSGDRQAGEQQPSPKRRPGAESAQEPPGGDGGSR